MRRFRHRLPSRMPIVLAASSSRAPYASRPPRLPGERSRLSTMRYVAPAVAVLVLAILAASVAMAPGSKAAASPGPRDHAAAALASGPAAPAAVASGGADSSNPPAIPVEPSPSIVIPKPYQLTGYRWPLAKGRVTLPFGPTEWGTFEVNGELFHDGVDMATFCGDHVVAAHDGIVLAEGRHFDQYLGWRGSLEGYFARLDKDHRWLDLPIVVVIDDGNGFRSMYAHLDSTVVNAGDHVKAGQLLGYEGRTGNASGCHLHYGLFDPEEPATFGLEPRIAKLMVLPSEETARIDPLAVLPYRPEVEEMRWRADRGGAWKR